MLIQLEIKNFAIIEHSIINFEKGFNVITGETGAGKSILLDALSAILGERTSKDIVRRGEEKAELKAVFTKSEDLKNKLSSCGIELEDDIVILERTITKTGRSISKINGSIQTNQVIKDISEILVEMCGQREHQTLLQEDQYITLIDELSSLNHKENLKKYKDTYKEYTETDSLLNSLLNGQREQEQLLDLYRFQKKEIEEMKLKIGEDEELESEKKVLASFEKISQSVGKTLSSLDAIDSVYEAQKNLNDAVRFDEKLQPLAERLEKTYYELQDIQAEVGDYFESAEYDEERLNEIMNRLENIKNIKRKYGDTIEDVLNYYEEVSSKVDLVENKEERIAELERQKTTLSAKLKGLANEIHTQRVNVAKKEEEKINIELKELCMPHANLVFELEKTEEFLNNGQTKIKVLFTANKGEELKPLAKVASGGELSRVLLAMKIATKVNSELTLVFDEIDEGVGGEVGRIIGEKLAKLGKENQIIVISHLPQVAAKADEHFLIRKSSNSDRTISEVNKLSAEERKFEVARMIYGDHADEITLKQAEEMLKR